MQKTDVNRTKQMTHKEQMEMKKKMDLPINKFLNTFGDDNKLKYSVAEKIKKYALNNPDPVLNDVRLINAMLHELRFHKNQSIKYLYEFNKEEGMIELVNNQNKVMSKEECYLNYISESHQIHTVLSRMREKLVTNLLSKCDGFMFTFEQYNQYVLDLEKIITDLGYVLFPTEVEVISPL